MRKNEKSKKEISTLTKRKAVAKDSDSDCKYNPTGIFGAGSTRYVAVPILDQFENEEKETGDMNLLKSPLILNITDQSKCGYPNQTMGKCSEPDPVELLNQIQVVLTRPIPFCSSLLKKLGQFNLTIDERSFTPIVSRLVCPPQLRQFDFQSDPRI